MRTLSMCAILLCAVLGPAEAQPQAKKKAPQIPALILTSPAFADGAEIPARFGAAAQNPLSPKLEWSNVPPDTVSFALIFHDPDGIPNKSSEDYLHWLVFNIPASVRELPEGMPVNPQLPDGTIQPRNRGIAGYIGPGAPASGPLHHYTFDIFALDTRLDLGPDATRADLMKAMEGHVLAKGILVGRFHR